MINLYDVLGLSPQAAPEQILDALQQHTLDPKLQKAVHAWLLDPEMRSRYDVRLKAQAPELFEALHELYHPNYASLLGLVFLPSACYLHAFNWQKLGNPKKAKQNHIIAVVFLVFMTLVTLIAVRLGIQIPIAIGLIWVFVWYYGLGKEQIA
ncbi:MAG: hypothetical protein Q3971_08435, partial [Moraxella sp.]|nr:hypothetical protein [Moraxella sp.]